MPYSQPTDLSAYLKTADLPPTAQFVNPVANTPITVAELMSSFPAGATHKGKYAQVSDLWGASVFGVMRCGYNGRIYYWEPTTQPTLAGQMPITGDMTVQPLSSYPIIELTGSLPALTTWNVTAGLTYAWPGAVKEFRGSLTSLLGTLNILGVGSTLNLALGGTRRIVCQDNGSSLIWRQIT